MAESDSWTSPEDVTGSWIGDDAPDDAEKLQAWIDRAEREIRARVPNLVARLDSGDEPDLLGLVRDVVVAMVTRVFRNPEGIRQINETTGPFTSSRTYGGDVPGGLGLTDDELGKLRGSLSGAFSIDLIPSTSPFYGG